MRARLIYMLIPPIVLIGASLLLLLALWARKRRQHQLRRRESLIEFECDGCGKKTLVDTQFAGRKGKCTACGAVVTIPESAPAIRLAPAQAHLAFSRVTGALGDVLRLDNPQTDRAIGVAAMIVGMVGLISGIVLLVYLICWRHGQDEFLPTISDTPPIRHISTN